jgi:hypothetical protein
MTDTPWEPPLTGTEAEQLLAALDRLRATFRYKTDRRGPVTGLEAEFVTA